MPCNSAVSCSTLEAAHQAVRDGDPSTALRLYKTVIRRETHVAGGSRLDRIIAHLASCDILISREAYASATRDAAGALALARHRHVPVLWKARSYSRLGTARWFEGEPAEAAIHFDQALQFLMAEKSSPRDDMIRAFDNLALALSATGQLEQAMACQAQALSYAQKSGSLDHIWRLKLRYANTAQDAGLLELSQSLLNETTPETGADPEICVRWHNAAAMLAERRGMLSSALEHYASAIAAYDDLPAPQAALAATLSNAALLRAETGNFRSARILLRRLQLLPVKQAPLSTKLGLKRVEALLAEYQGDYAFASRKWQQALRMVSRSADGAKPIAAELAADLARVYRERGLHKRAIDTLEPYARSNLRASQLDEPLLPAIQYLAYQIEQHQGVQLGPILHRIFAQQLERPDATVEWQLFQVLGSYAALQNKNRAAVLFGKLAIRSIVRALTSLPRTSIDADRFQKEKHRLFAEVIERLLVQSRLAEAAQFNQSI